MHYLNESFRIWYAPKTFKSCPEGVKLIVVVPDSTIEGIFCMEELILGTLATGTYYYDYTPNKGYGKYLFMILVTGEGPALISSEVFYSKNPLSWKAS